MPKVVETTTGLYRLLVGKLAAAGQRDEAMELARLAVKHGVWAHPLQRPMHFISYLPAAPTYDPSSLPIVAYLERHYPAIRAEVDRVTDPSMAGFTSATDASLVQGRWDQVIFYEGGNRFSHASTLFPHIAGILDGLPERTLRAGWIMLSWLHPGARIAPHCGFSNARLRIHLGIRTPPGATIRVGDQVLAWQEGRCLVFDDSFEHEVWHRGTEPRVVLLVDAFNPALSESDEQELATARTMAKSGTLRETLRSHHIRRVAREGDDRLHVELDASSERKVRQLLSDAGIRSIDVGEDRMLPPTIENE